VKLIWCQTAFMKSPPGNRSAATTLGGWRRCRRAGRAIQTNEGRQSGTASTYTTIIHLMSMAIVHGFMGRLALSREAIWAPLVRPSMRDRLGDKGQEMPLLLSICGMDTQDAHDKPIPIGSGCASSISVTKYSSRARWGAQEPERSPSDKIACSLVLPYS
jgi:hypothetical protein